MTRHLIQQKSFTSGEWILFNRNNMQADVEILIRAKNGNTDEIFRFYLPLDFYKKEDLHNRLIIIPAAYLDDWKYTYVGIVLDGWSTFHLYKAIGGAKNYDCVVYEIY